MYLYFPSCTFTRLMPGTSARIRAFMRSRGVRVGGCCRPGIAQAAETGVTPVTVCGTCRIILAENCPDAPPVSLMEYIDALADFPFPQYGGEAVTVQDCYRAKEDAPLRAAVRSLLAKMGFHVVELPGLPEERNFDGDWLMRPMREDNLRLAPVRFAQIMRDRRPADETQSRRLLREYAARFATPRVVCYCNSCWQGLAEALPEGRQAAHIAQLLFPGER